MELVEWNKAPLPAADGYPKRPGFELNSFQASAYAE
jgi:hypothetical protein